MFRYNASYEVDFQFTNGAQSINVTKATHMNPVIFASDSPLWTLRMYNASIDLHVGTTVAETRNAMQNTAYQVSNLGDMFPTPNISGVVLKVDYS